MSDPLGPAVPLRIAPSRRTHWGWITYLRGPGKKVAITACGLGTRCGQRAKPSNDAVDCAKCRKKVQEDPEILAPSEMVS